MIGMVLSCLPVCTTVKAATNDFKYISAVKKISTGEIYLYVSNEPVRVLADRLNNRWYKYFIGLLDKQITNYDIVNISYNNDIGQWVSSFDKLIDISSSRESFQIYPETIYLKEKLVSVSLTDENSTDPAKKLNDFFLYSNYNITSDEKSVLGGFSTNFNELNLPAGITEETILNIVNESLNKTTQTTTQAQTAQGSLSADYQSYQNGSLSPQSLQVSVDNTVQTLNNIRDNQGNTLADLMAINNGLTYAQTVQDKINADEIIATQTVTSTVQLNINGYINQANNAYNDFTSGIKTQSETIEVIQQQIINLNNIITSGQAKTSADVAAVNAAINTVQNTSNSVHNYAELDKTVSDKSQQSDNEELNYITNLQEETTSSLEELSISNSINSSDSDEAKNIFSIVWENKAVQMFLPIAACFMIISIVLGAKYKL